MHIFRVIRCSMLLPLYLLLSCCFVVSFYAHSTIFSTSLVRFCFHFFCIQIMLMFLPCLEFRDFFYSCKFEDICVVCLTLFSLYVFIPSQDFMCPLFYYILKVVLSLFLLHHFDSSTSPPHFLTYLLESSLHTRFLP